MHNFKMKIKLHSDNSNNNNKRINQCCMYKKEKTRGGHSTFRGGVYR